MYNISKASVYAYSVKPMSRFSINGQRSQDMDHMVDVPHLYLMILSKDGAG